jgi:autotransporter-associated beta strand protein
MKPKNHIFRSSYLPAHIALSLGLAVAGLSTHSAQAVVTDTWVGNTDANWNTAANWDTAVVPTTGDSLVFGAAGSKGATLTNNITSLSVNNFTINSTASAFTFNGNLLILTGTLTDNATVNDDHINLALGGVGGLNQAGTKGLYLSGNNTYSGATTIGSGASMEIDAAAAADANSDYTVNGTMEAYSNGGNPFSMTIGALNGSGTVKCTKGSGSAAPATLTVGSTGASGSFSGAIVNNAWGAIITHGVTKVGAGTQTLSGANTYTGPTSVNAGTLTVSGSLVGTANNAGQINVGQSGNTANATLNIQSGATITQNSANILIGNGTSTANGIGAVYQSGGTVSGVSQIQLGANTGGSYGYYNLSGGTIGLKELDISGGSNLGNLAHGVLDISGGTMTVANWLVPTRGTGAGISIINMTGGTLNYNGANEFSANWNTGGSTFVLNIANASLLCSASAVNLNLMRTAASANLGEINLLSGGLLRVNSLSPSTATGNSVVNFNGGTLKANAANATFITTVNTAVNVYGGGGTIDNNGIAITIPKAFSAPAGSGINSAVTFTPGSGYVGAPAVTFSGGGGTGAAGYATISGGAVNGIVITSPGTGYTSAPTVTLTGGGYTTAATATAPTPTANTSGGMTFQGSGTTTLTGANTYAGNTTINGGNLVVATAGTGIAAGGTATVSGSATMTVNSGATVASAVAVNNTSGSGVVVNSGGSISGDSTVAGTLTVNGTVGNATVSAGGTLTANGTGGNVTVSAGGTLTVNGTVGNVTVSAAGTLEGSGTVSGLATLSGAASAINLQNGVANTLTLSGGLTLNGDNALTFDVATAGSDQIAVTGTVGLPFSGTVTVNLNKIGAVSAGTIKLLSATSGTMDATMFTLATAAPTGISWQLANDADGHSLDLVITTNAPTTAYWKGGVDGNWSTADSGPNFNWASDSAGTTTTGATPGTPTAVTFSAIGAGNLSTTLGGNLEITSLTLNSSGNVTIGGANTLQNDGNLTLNSGAGTLTINADGYILGGNQVVADNSSSALLISSPISGAHTLTVNSSGSGTTTLSGANSHSGTTVSAGTLALIGSGTLGSSSAAVTASGGTLDLGATSQTVGAVTVSGGTVQNGTLTGASYALQSGTVSAVLAGSSVAATQTTSGTTTLSAANTYTGGTTINAGVLKLGVANAVPGNTYAGDVSVTGTLDLFGYSDTINGLNGAGTVDTTASGSPTLTVGANGDGGTFSGVIQNTAGQLALIKAGAGTLILNGVNSYSGGSTINAGELRIRPTTAGNGAGLGSGTVTLNAGQLHLLMDLNSNPGSTQNFTNNFVLNGGTITSEDGNTLLGISTSTINVTGATTLQRMWGHVTGKSLQLNGILQGSAALTLQGTGGDPGEGASVWINNAANTYSGTVTVNANVGTGGFAMVDGANNALQFANINLLGNAGGSDTSVKKGGIQFPSGVTAPVLGSLAGTGNFTLTDLSGTPAAVTLGVGANNSSTSFSGVMSGAGGLTKSGAGTMTLSGTNTFTGNLVINGGTIAVGTGIVGTTASSIASNLGDFGSGVSRSITINNSGNLTFTGGNVFGYDNATLSGVTLVVNQGGVFQTAVNGTGSGYFNKIGAVNLNGGTISVGNGDTGYKGALALLGTVTVGGSTASTIGILSGATTNDVVTLGQSNAGISAVTFNVADVTGDSGADLTVSAGLANGANGVAASSITKTGPGTMALTGTNTYTGATTVNSGTLALGATGSIATSTGVTIAAGATLDTTAASFTMPATQTVTFKVDGSGAGSSGLLKAATLDITNAHVAFTVVNPLDDNAYVLATYTSLSGTAFASVTPPTGYTINYAYNSGTQIALVKNAGYDSWATNKGLDGTNNGPQQDPNNNGISNLMEYVLNGDPLNGESPASILPTENSSGADFVFDFHRLHDSASDTTQVFQYGTDLTGWTDVAITAGTYGSVTVAVIADSATIDHVTVTVPKGADTKLFGRLHVTKP